MRTPQTASLSLSRNSPAFSSAKILQFTDLQQLNRKPILQEHLRISARICPAAHCFPSDRRGLFAHTHPSRAVAVCLHPYRQARDKSNTDERQNVSPIIRGETKKPAKRGFAQGRSHNKQVSLPYYLIGYDTSTLSERKT